MGEKRNNLPAEPTRPGERYKLCHVVVGSVLAGAQRVMLDICQSVDPARYECHVMCHEEGPLTEELRRNKIRYYLLPTLTRAIRPQRDWAGILQIRRICREHRFDLVHTHSSKGGLLGRVGARWAGVPHVLHHVHGYPFHEFSTKIERALYVQLEKFGARFCDRIIFVNDEERRTSIDKGWIPDEKGVTIYNGTEIDLFDPRRSGTRREEFRRENGLEDDEIAILVSGRLERQKQSLILPEIAAALDEMKPEAKWRIMVAGTGDLEEPLREKTRELGMERRINLLGWSPEPHKVVSGSDLMLLPSLWEGLPLVLIEAQAAGLPIVASNVKGNREVVTEETGTLCRPQEPKPYAEALAHLCQDAALRRRLGIAARRRAEAEFDSRQAMGSVVKLYETLIVGRREPAALA